MENKNKKIELDDAQIAQVEALAAFLPIKRIAGYLGFSVDTFHQIKKRDERVLVAYNRGVGKVQYFAGKTLLKFMQYEQKDADSPSIPLLQMQLDATKFYIKTKCDWKEENTILVEIDKDQNRGDGVIKALSQFVELTHPQAMEEIRTFKGIEQQGEQKEERKGTVEEMTRLVKEEWNKIS